MVHTLLGTIRAESGTGGPFDLVNGIPVHPLVVHAAVVLVPLTALGVLVMVFWPRFSRRHGWLVVASSVAATLACWVAKEAGEALVSRVGQPGFDHGDLGDAMPVVAGVLMLATTALWWVDRAGGAEGSPRRGLRIAVAVLAALVAVGNLFWIYRVGDSGAKSVWSGRVTAAGTATSAAGGSVQGEDDSGDDDSGDDDSGDDSGEGGSDDGTARPSQGSTSTESPAATSPATASYTLAQVATHDSASDCWAAIDGGVYDLTAWIDQHPGGAQRILDICGADGTAAFEGQHAGQAGPAANLSQVRIGSLA